MLTKPVLCRKACTTATGQTRVIWRKLDCLNLSLQG